jgi:hypothetical protein
MEAFSSGVNASHLTGRTLNVEIITVSFIYTTLLGAYPYVAPAFDSAREDIGTMYPKLNISQSFVYTRKALSGCEEWMTMSENQLAAFYYDPRRNADGKIDVTAFVMSGMLEVRFL